MLPADTVVLSTGSRPRIPDWAPIDGDRVLTTRDAYPPPALPEHLIVIGSGVTGVEFVHMFSAFGCEVTLIVSRQQVLPQKDPEVAAVLEDDFLRRGVRLFKGARAESASTSTTARSSCAATTAGSARGTHALLCHRLDPQLRGARPRRRPASSTDGGYVVVDHNCQSSVPHIYAAGDLSGKLPLSSVASMQGRKIAEHALGLHAARTATSTTRRRRRPSSPIPRSPTSAWPRPMPSPSGRKVRVTKVPFSASAKALINDDPRGFVKIVSDPATGVVLGGSIVGPPRRRADLGDRASRSRPACKVTDIVESLLVHPALAEALADAAE